MEALHLDDHGRHKLIQLARDRYDAKKDELNLVVKQCPTRKQNLEYAKYLLKVLCLEAKVPVRKESFFIIYTGSSP